MIKGVKFSVPEPCKININEMNICENDKIRFCRNCKSNVYDVRDLSREEIIDLKTTKDNICVIVNSNQLTKSNKIKKIALSSLFIFSSLFSTEIKAQYKSKLGSFEIKQSLIQTDSIQISGFVYVKGSLGWKKISNYEIDVFRDEEFIETITIKDNKKIKIQYEFEPNENITLIIKHKKYENMALKNIRFANTKIKAYLEPKRYRLVGRFF